jgi:nitric oxide reductase large subunit
MTTPHTYATRADAYKAITGLNSGVYYLAHGEYERPDYTARKLRNSNRYYIHARRYFYAGTLHAKKSGPLTVYDLDSL